MADSQSDSQSDSDSDTYSEPDILQHVLENKKRLKKNTLLLEKVLEKLKTMQEAAANVQGMAVNVPGHLTELLSSGSANVVEEGHIAIGEDLARVFGKTVEDRINAVKRMQKQIHSILKEKVMEMHVKDVNLGNTKDIKRDNFDVTTTLAHLTIKKFNTHSRNYQFVSTVLSPQHFVYYEKYVVGDSLTAINNCEQFAKALNGAVKSIQSHFLRKGFYGGVNRSSGEPRKKPTHKSSDVSIVSIYIYTVIHFVSFKHVFFQHNFNFFSTFFQRFRLSSFFQHLLSNFQHTFILIKFIFIFVHTFSSLSFFFQSKNTCSSIYSLFLIVWWTELKLYHANCCNLPWKRWTKIY